MRAQGATPRPGTHHLRYRRHEHTCLGHGAWAPGDRIGITATKADGTVLLSNAPYVTTDVNGTFTPEGDGFYYQDGDDVTFTAYYPFAESSYIDDGGGEKVMERPLSVGDFYMKDGTILPKESVPGEMPREMRKDCLDVVSWVGENEGIHWTQTGDREGDHLLMRDHPRCVHGIVVALRDASAGAVWAEGSGANENLNNWANSFQGFNAEEQADWLAIYESPASNHGYCVSHIVKLYGTYHPDATFPAYNTIGDYATRHPAPGSSSGWYFPNQSELTMMCYGMADNYSTGSSKERRDLLNGLFRKAGGDVLDGSYWSIYERDYYSWYFDFGGNTSYGVDPRSETHKVRAVLAF